MSSVEKPSKGAEKILLAQIKQEFSAPAEAIEQYIDLVEQFAVQNNLEISSEINQIKEAEDKEEKEVSDDIWYSVYLSKKTRKEVEKEMREKMLYSTP